MDSLAALRQAERKAAPSLKRYGSFEDVQQTTPTDTRPASRQQLYAEHKEDESSSSSSDDEDGNQGFEVGLPKSLVGSRRARSLSRKWTRSREALTLKGRHKRGERRSSFAVFDVTPSASPERFLVANDGPIDFGNDSQEQVQDKGYGVLKIEAIAQRISSSGIRRIFQCIYLCTSMTSLEANTTPLVEPYLMSVFGAHALMPTVAIVANLAFAIGRPPFARMLDVFGRAESLAFAIACYGAGFSLESISTSVVTFTVAKVLASIGGQGIQLGTQILIADTTSMSDRGIYTASLAIPWMVTIWVGPFLGQLFLRLAEVGYRAAYATFAVAAPLLTLPLIYTLSSQFARSQSTFLPLSPSFSSAGLETVRRSFSQHRQHPKSRTVSTAHGSVHIIQPQTFYTLMRATYKELDLVGMLLCSAAGFLLLLPISLAATWPEAWQDYRLYLCLVSGAICAYAFIKNEQLCPTPFLPGRLLENRTIKAGCLLGFFHFTCQLTYESYFASFLQVARYCSPRTAQFTNQSYIAAACVSALIGGWATRRWQQYKMIGLIGVLIHIFGAILMVRFRKLENPLYEVVGSQIIAGFGGGLTTISMQLGVQSVVPHADVAMATAVLLTITQFGAAVGGALAGSIWTSVLPKQLYANLPPELHSKIPDIMGSLVVAMSYARGTPERDAIDAAYVHTQWLLNLLALVALGPALLAMLAMENVKFDDVIHTEDTVLILGDATPLGSDDEG